jgi:hypothetical protein
VPQDDDHYQDEAPSKREAASDATMNIEDLIKEADRMLVRDSLPSCSNPFFVLCVDMCFSKDEVARMTEAAEEQKQQLKAKQAAKEQKQQKVRLLKEKEEKERAEKKLDEAPSPSPPSSSSPSSPTAKAAAPVAKKEVVKPAKEVRMC